MNFVCFEKKLALQDWLLFSVEETDLQQNEQKIGVNWHLQHRQQDFILLYCCQKVKIKNLRNKVCFFMLVVAAMNVNSFKIRCFRSSEIHLNDSHMDNKSSMNICRLHSFKSHLFWEFWSNLILAVSK